MKCRKYCEKLLLTEKNGFVISGKRRIPKSIREIFLNLFVHKLSTISTLNLEINSVKLSMSISVSLSISTFPIKFLNHVWMVFTCKTKYDILLHKIFYWKHEIADNLIRILNFKHFSWWNLEYHEKLNSEKDDTCLVRVYMNLKKNRLFTAFPYLFLILSRNFIMTGWTGCKGLLGLSRSINYDRIVSSIL